MSDWTLGAVKARNMELIATCETESCRQLRIFDLDALIKSVGADYKIDDIPELTCEQCNGPLKVQLAMGEPPEDSNGSGGVTIS